MKLYLESESDTLKLGAQIAQHCPSQQFTIHLEGDLGAGKTTLTRGLLRQLGHKGNVKSPTYTLVEHYSLKDRAIFHFDLYRLTDPEELDYLGLDDYLSHNSLCIIEWASQGGDFLPKPDLIITLSYQNHSRNAELTVSSPAAKALCEMIQL
ncbi:MAG: tRNA (adenosine(37)-N6)-threonylcarbamoyltransferase complex ATPase subunit type 1 TsaE [Methylophaga sp.]|nr:tRNA (adenosine(37)-N6)-threonylcarbamoyltransferase complex ATPase subunit type 1 TsaE [Methylophaga sp.]